MILPKRLPNQKNYNKYKTKSIYQKETNKSKRLNTQTKEENHSQAT